MKIEKFLKLANKYSTRRQRQINFLRVLNKVSPEFRRKIDTDCLVEKDYQDESILINIDRQELSNAISVFLKLRRELQKPLSYFVSEDEDSTFEGPNGESRIFLRESQ